MPILRQGQEAEFVLPLGGYVSIDATGGAVAEIALPLGSPGGPLRRVSGTSETVSGILAGSAVTVSCSSGVIGYGVNAAADSPGGSAAVTAASLATTLEGAAVSDPASLARIQSSVSGGKLFAGVNLFSGGNFIANGLQDSFAHGEVPYNWSSWVADAVYVPMGAAASYKLTNMVAGSATALGDALIPVPANKLLEVSLNLTLGNLVGGAYSAAGTQYLYIACYDGDGLNIPDSTVTRNPGSAQTTLAVALNPGDTTMTLTDATGWAGDIWYRRQMLWWPMQAEGIHGYKEGTGRIHLPYTYSRHLLGGWGGGYTGAWLQSGVSGNVVTFNPAAYPAGWPGPAVAAGTPVQASNGGGGNRYFHALSAQPVGTRSITATLSVNESLTPTVVLWPGTTKVRLMGLFNHGGSSATDVRVSAVMLRVK